MKLRRIVEVLEQIAPTRLAERWDNVGLLAGDPDDEITRALITIDLTPPVIEEAMAVGAALVIAYHPPIFGKLVRVVAGSPLALALRNGIALYSPHTALDVVTGGTNDALADVLALGDRRPLRASARGERDVKLVTFMPTDAVERVSEALWSAGAGDIGRYSRCSFRSEGTGTFFGEAGAQPVVGEAGRLERAAEVRVEMVVPLARIEPVLAALRAAHPYEEVAFDLVRLAAPPDGLGIGRVGTIAVTSRRALLDRIKVGLAIERVLVAGPLEGDARRVAVGAGSCGDLVDDAIAAGADLYLTGELSHHDADRAARAGMTVVCALHSHSERPVLPVLAAQLVKEIAELEVRVSERDRDPFLIL